jgi:thiosulfate dehydrogenase
MMTVVALLSQAPAVAVGETLWSVPDIDAAPQDAQGALIRRGADIVSNSIQYISAEAVTPASRVAGNDLACASCHLRGGTVKLGLPLAGATEPLAAKINNCIVTSLNGRPLDASAPEMTAIIAYIRFLGSTMSPAAASEARALPLPATNGDVADGRKVFADTCMICHDNKGQGKRHGADGDGFGYLVPPVWGDDSFSDASDMMKPAVTANFIYNNMPEGASWDAPAMSPDEAANSAAFVLSAPRPHR